MAWGIREELKLQRQLFKHRPGQAGLNGLGNP